MYLTSRCWREETAVILAVTLFVRREDTVVPLAFMLGLPQSIRPLPSQNR